MKKKIAARFLSSLYTIRPRYMNFLILWVLKHATFIYICYNFLSSHVNDNQETACIFFITPLTW